MSTWRLYCNNSLVESFDYHSKAKKAYHFARVEADENMLDVYYKIKQIN